jgi:protein ImuB
VAVLARPGLQGEVAACNTAARRRGITVGMRHAAALALAPGLQAEVVDEAALKPAGEELLALLLRRAPGVEPGEPGVFWLDPEGLVKLFGDLNRWGEGLLASLQAAGFVGSLVVGFHRHRAHALARVHRGVLVVGDAAEETALAARVPLARLDAATWSFGQPGAAGDPPPRRASCRCRRRSCGPASARRRRSCTRGTRATRGRCGRRCRPSRCASRFELEPPDDHSERLLFAMVPLLDKLLARLAAEGEALAALQVAMELDHAAPLRTRSSRRRRSATIRRRAAAGGSAAAAARVDRAAGAGGPRDADGRRGRGRTASSWRCCAGAGRDLHAANQAIARVRAAFGDGSVTRARLRPAHLPEAGFAWEPVTAATCPKVQDAPANHGAAPGAPLCRRLLARPRPLPPWTGTDDGRWLAGTGLCRGAVIRMTGRIASAAGGGPARSSATTTSPRPAPATSRGSTTTGRGGGGSCTRSWTDPWDR